MGSLDSDVNATLQQMRDSAKSSGSQTAKGSYGEKAVFKILEEIYQKQGGILIHSYEYKVDPDQAGNIKKNDSGGYFIENLGSVTEIDVLFVTKYRVYPIEVKAYKAKEIKLTDGGIEGCFKTDKSPVHQNEMHCRHLYSRLFRALQDGSTEYIVPIVVFVDQADIIDDRSDWQRSYIRLAIIDTLKQLIEETNTPLTHQLNLTLIDSILKEMMTSSEKYLPVRY